MIRNRKITRPIVRNPAYRLAFEHLDEALEQNTQSDYSEKTELLGMAMFGDLWHPRKQTDTDVLPK